VGKKSTIKKQDFEETEMKSRDQKRPRKEGNPDLRHQHQAPALEIPQLVEELKSYLQPSLFTPLKYLPGNHENRTYA
jgi:3',5'-cyclic AMP phosphodiesterase CpdA